MYRYLSMISILQWNLAVLLNTLLLISCSTSDNNEESDGKQGDKTNISVYLQQNGFQNLNLSTGQDLVSCNVFVCKSALSDREVSIRLRTWSNNELEAYNLNNGTNFQLLPENLYQLEETLTLIAGEKQKNVEIQFHSSDIFSAWKVEQPNYVLPLRLESTSVAVQEDKKDLLLTLDIQAPIIKLESISGEILLNQEKVEVDIKSYYDFSSTNQATFHCALSVAPEAIQLVNEYNAAHGTSYELLPDGSYTLGELTYTAGRNQVSTKLIIQSLELRPTYYLLPLCLTSVDNEAVLVDKSVRILTLVRGYCNPIIALSAPDPTVIRAQDGYFYLYGTENTRNVPIYRSKDLVNWEYKGTAFTDATRSTWDGDHNIWAPEIRYFNNQYVLYYSWAIWGDEWRSNVGVAISDSPLGPFIDKGCLIDSKVIGVQNSIDQFFYEDNGTKYMFWGSFRGIYVTELTDDGLDIKKKTDRSPVLKKRICGNRFEGTNIFKRGEYYYLFASIGTCCNGATSTYQTVVGRSKNILGPYLNKTGGDMLYDYCEIIMSGNEVWAGPGHNSILIQDDAGTDWIIYHGYKKKEAENGRYVLMDKLIWSSDGWPSVKGNAPSLLELVPYFQKEVSYIEKQV